VTKSSIRWLELRVGSANVVDNGREADVVGKWFA